MEYENGNQVQENGTTRDYISTYLNGQKTNRLTTFDDRITTNHVIHGSYADYSYLLDGRRTAKKTGEYEETFSGYRTYLYTKESRYLYDGQNVLHEVRSDRPNVTYTYSQKCSGCGSGCGASTSVFTDHPISMTQDGERYYYLFNGIGSVI